jgi:hypothetical protein
MAPFAGLVYAVDAIEEGGLARTVGADDGIDLTLLDLERMSRRASMPPKEMERFSTLK